MKSSKLRDSTWIEGINSLRFVLALIVLLSHFENPVVKDLKSANHILYNLSASVIEILFNGVAAVITFFIISGYVIHQSSKTRDISWKNFLVSRYLRILLPLIFIYFLGYKYNHPEKGILWSLICELVYYTLYPFFRKYKLNWRKLFTISFIISIVVIVIFGYHDILAFYKQTSLNYQGHYWQFGIFVTWILGLPCWILGVLISEKGDIIMSVSKTKIIIYRLIIFTISIVLNYLTFHAHLSYLLYMNFFAFFLYKWIQNEIAYFRDHKPILLLEKLGYTSYSMYILHPLCYTFLFQMLSLTFLNYLFAIFVCILLSILFYKLIERPSHILSKNFKYF